MSKRTSILLPDELYERLQHRARRQVTSVSEEIREAPGRECQDENPNQWLLDLAEAFKDVEWKPVPSSADPDFSPISVRVWLHASDAKWGSDR
jgi:predicted DNA-binding protein